MLFFHSLIRSFLGPLRLLFLVMLLLSLMLSMVGATTIFCVFYVHTHRCYMSMGSSDIIWFWCAMFSAVILLVLYCIVLWFNDAQFDMFLFHWNRDNLGSNFLLDSLRGFCLLFYFRVYRFYDLHEFWLDPLFVCARSSIGEYFRTINAIYYVVFVFFFLLTFFSIFDIEILHISMSAAMHCLEIEIIFYIRFNCGVHLDLLPLSSHIHAKWILVTKHALQQAAW